MVIIIINYNIYNYYNYIYIIYIYIYIYVVFITPHKCYIGFISTEPEGEVVQYKLHIAQVGVINNIWYDEVTLAFTDAHARDKHWRTYLCRRSANCPCR